MDQKLVHRAYCALRLNQVRGTKNQPPKRDVLLLAAPAILSDTGAVSFVGDSLYSGRDCRLFNFSDERSRTALAIEVSLLLSSVRVIAVAERCVGSTVDRAGSDAKAVQNSWRT